MSPPHRDDNSEPLPKPVNGKIYTGIWALFQMIGNIAGFAALITVAVFGGEMKRQVQINTQDIALLQHEGSPNLKSTIQALNLEVDNRKESDIIYNRRLDDVRADFSQRITNITGLLEKMVEQQTQLLALIKVQQQIKP